MKATIISFRRGRHTQKPNQFLLEIEGCDSRQKAMKFIGKKVAWVSSGKEPKKISGVITNAHGNSGVLRARFSRGLPGEAVTTKIEILE
ncbi:MAG: 50S ribosomal protein L35ae [Candidatus Aenigmarchaeota archaeon]|nr:50S ribosomal protein L35ae [Candidatus Aenigmarchaeota archaeon]